jgi:hypothetical protein
MGKISTLRSYKINQLGNITIPTLISSAGNSQNYIFSETDDIYFEAEIYLNSYDITNPILSSMNTQSYIINEFAFFIAGVDELGGRGIPAGSFVVYNGERGSSLSCHYTDSAFISLNTWTKVIAKRTNGIWSLFINDIACSVSRFNDDEVPNDQFGNENLFVYIGRLQPDNLNLDGQIRNIILGNKLINNKISIKKQNLGGGKIIASKLSSYSLSILNIAFGTVLPGDENNRCVITFTAPDLIRTFIISYQVEVLQNLTSNADVPTFSIFTSNLAISQEILEGPCYLALRIRGVGRQPNSFTAWSPIFTYGAIGPGCDE